MSANVGLLKVSLATDTAEFSRGLNKASGEAQSFGASVGKIATVAGAAFAAAGATISTLVMQTAQAADVIGKMSQRVGVAATELQKLQYAASLSDVSTSQLQTGLVMLARTMGEAAKGSGQTAEAFAAIGVAVTDSAGNLRDSDAVLKDIAQAFSGYEDGAAKAALAQRLFGRSGAELIPLLNNGADGLNNMGREAERLGIIMSDDVVRASQEFNDGLSKIQQGTGALARELSGPIIISLANLITRFFEARNAGLDFIQSLKQAFSDTSVIQRLAIDIEAQYARVERARRMADANPVEMDGGFALQQLEAEERKLRDLVATYEGAARDITASASSFEVKPVPAPTLATLQSAGSALKTVADAAKEAAQAEREAAVVRQQAIDAARDGLDGIEAQVQSQRQYNEEIGLSGNALADLRARRLEDAAAQNEQLASTARMLGLSREEVAAYEAKAQALRELAALQREGAAVQAAQESAAEAEREWRRVSESIEQDLTDALMRGFESGKDFGKNLADTLKNMFQTLVLRPMLQPVMAGVAGGISSAMGGGGVGNVGTSLLGNAVGSMFGSGGLTGALMGGAGWLTGATTLGGSLAAAGSLIGTGTAAGAMSGIAMGAGALAPIALPLLALGGLFGENKPTNYWQHTSVDLATGEMTGKRDTGSRRWSAGNAATSEALGASAFELSEIIKSITGAQYFETVNFGVGNKDKQLIIDGAHQDIAGKGEIARVTSEELWREFEKTLVERARDDLPESMQKVVDAMLDPTAELSGEADTLSRALTMMKDDFSVFSDESDKWAEAQKALNEQFKSLNMITPQSVGEFKKLASELDLTTAAGRDAMAALYGIAPAFYEIARVVEGVFNSISRTTAESIRDIEMSILDSAGKYKFLDTEIDSLIGQLANATLPEEIERIFSQINQRTVEAYNLLDSNEQRRLAPEFIDRLYEIESIAQSRLSVTPLEGGEDGVKAQRDAAETQRAAAETQRDAAAQAQQAAQAMQEAVKMIPNSIVIQQSGGMSVSYA